MTSLKEIGLPPVLPELKDILENYLLDFESLPIHDPKNTKKFWPTYPDPLRLFNPSLNPVTTSLEVERDPATGIITGVKETFSNELGSTAKNSFSLQRVPGPPEEAVRGSSTNYPFWPGGIPEPTLLGLQSAFCDDTLFDPEHYLTRHPKLSGGLKFEKEEDNSQKTSEKHENKDEIVNLADMLKADDSIFNIFDVKQETKCEKTQLIGLHSLTEEDASLIDEFKVDSVSPKEEHVIKISEMPAKELPVKGTEWAIVVDVNSPVDDFSVKVSNPACSYPFELDNFQKQAIIRLENHESVFVAAHTSAGKTVVAEYSIALSLKHMTRAIYTSPIKALSNQKYRELKIKFDDVGLLTGDLQINPKASCLIMTTEILQSMLYNGSDTIRDLEWVIFDEVHYINNAERGHVWEEVIIMLPAHVNIVLLSATVPNTVEFADWIGRIKKKKIFVISTSKRPVPLEHFLYTGSGGKTKDERFMVVDANGNFMMKGYNDAVAAKQEREKKSQKMVGPKQKTHIPLSGKQEMNMWIGLLDHLSKKELLPVVAFTLSKKKCDQNAMQLMSQDLTTPKEKHEIHSFIKKCTDCLQGTDKNLPQVIQMQTLLKNGIGVHHSGVLPILKEVVEMLFAKGLVKLLFATETFAMGVNMPARSVVFDSITKHDGTKFRELVPSEYIQMAGRAGRRGLDTTGTVIILCKMDVVEVGILRNMMLGKPTRLESQFKLTYSMILNLLRVEALRVEDMMKRSFSESFRLVKQSSYEGDLIAKEEELKQTTELTCLMCNDIGSFYDYSRSYVEMRKKSLKLILTQPNARNLLKVGRIIMISQGPYQNYIACIVEVNRRDNDKYTTLILKDKSIDESISPEMILIKECLHAADDSFHILEKTSDHQLLEVEISSIVAVSKMVLKVRGEQLVKNVKEREIPRFKDNPPGQSVVEVLTELQRINEGGPSVIDFIEMSNLGVKEMNAVEKIQELQSFKSVVVSHQCLECPQFAEHFALGFKNFHLTEDIKNIKFLMSEEALRLHPEYQSRIQVLKKLGYIEDGNTVTIKGRVACEMGNHELMVSELLLENVFANKPVEEITALLSSLVFQQKNCSEPTLTEDLMNGKKEFKRIATKIGEAQRDCGLLEPVGDFVDQFKFGLCEVVYQWSLGMSFDKIMELTDVQEGITVKCIQRLDETLRDVRNAARIIGDPNLYEKMEKASTSIKRDIVFTASLYTQ